MAWLQNLAGRAEDLLNKIDQNAATVLSDGTSRLEKGEILTSVDTIEQKKIDTIVESTSEVTSGVLKLNSSNYTTKEDDFFTQTQIEDTSTILEELPKSQTGSPGTKSLSSHNSFILTEEVQHYTEMITKLESEICDLNKQLLNLQHLYSELRNENANLRSQIDASNYLVQTAQSEMEQYKARAQRILQEKENLILVKNEKTSQSPDQILTNYIEELKKEVEFQENRNLELSEKVGKLTEEISLLQQQIVSNQKSSQQSVQLLQENLMTEKKIRLMAEEDCRLKSQELELKIQELTQQYHILQTKNEEIKILKDVLKNKSNFSTNSDYESRLKSLTDTLMKKQNNLETVTTERNALRLQLEKLETEYQNNLMQLERAQVRSINMNDTDDVKSQVPQFMRVSPFDAGVTRRVKHAYSTVDAISVRTGIFLRRYPVARVFVFCYMVLLHFWALILLFIYAPSNR